MKSIKFRILAAVLCLALLCGCAAENNTAGNNEASGSPGTENITPDSDTQKDNNAEATGVSSDENEEPSFAVLTSEELAEWESYFNTREANGLLRFPYADLGNDPDQLAPYLRRLFYDIGEPESEFSDEELALLSETDLWLELDAFRLTRDFLNEYLFVHFNIPAEKTENLLDAAKLGVYLEQYDAWYIAHGDIAFGPYEFGRGIRYEDGTINLFYLNESLNIAQDNGELDSIDAPMVITLMPREDGTWYVAAHEIRRSLYADSFRRLWSEQLRSCGE